jgi:hypothetical protein
MLDSNHGTFYVNQLMALKLIVNDTAGATTLGRGYFGGIYKGQIQPNGNQVCSSYSAVRIILTSDQPMEASRSRPYHYRNFNIAGMIVSLIQ